MYNKFHKLSDGRYRATEDILIKYGTIEVIINKGDVTDFMTCPWYIKPFFRGNKYALPSACHDQFYEKQIFTRILSDAIFYEIMKTAGIKPSIRFIIYSLVLFLGWTHWKS